MGHQRQQHTPQLCVAYIWLHPQAAQQSGFVPTDTTVWDYIAEKTDNPDFTRAVRALRVPAQARKGPSPAGKPPVVLYNMCASCKEKKTAQRSGKLELHPCL